MGKYKLKDGIVLRPNGVNSKVTNENLTDEMAVLYIKNGKAKKENFIINTKKIEKNGNSK